jgi:predicted N-acetyltransferase YhbS
MIDIVDEVPAHIEAREDLLDRSFGPDRFLKTSERLREGRIPAFAFTALDDEVNLAGTLRLWHVTDALGNRALLLGPLAVEETCRSQKVGARLMRHALNQAAVSGHGAIILVGDLPYYERFGFGVGHLENVTMPGPVDWHRFLAIDLVEGTTAQMAGCLEAAGAVDLSAVGGRGPSRRALRRRAA